MLSTTVFLEDILKCVNFRFHVENPDVSNFLHFFHDFLGDTF